MTIDATEPVHTNQSEQEPQDTRRRFYRLRTPGTDGTTRTAVSVRVTPEADLYLAVGSGRRRMYLTPDEAWAAWRCLSEAVASLGAPPDWIRTHISPSSR
jgi:hypothetical protein